MDKLRMESPDMTAQNIDRIAALFPNCVTEMPDENGKIKRAINFELLKQMLSPDVVDGDEAYEFTWVGKKAAIVEANKPIRKTLRPCVAESKDWDTTENLYIEGDNLEVLKLLQESYLGKVKMIYIDPPYNTGNDFIYADDFMRSQEEENEQMGMYDEDENRLFKNTDTNGRFHSDWCSMIYSRLMLARNLLTDDGVILVSIGDREVKNLQAILDEVFGANNQVCCFVWKSRAKPTNAGNARFRPQKVAEYILVYSKTNPDNLIFNVVPAKERTYPHNDENGAFRTTTILTSNRGTFRRDTMRFESHGYTPNEDFRWKAGKETIDRLYDTGHMYITDDGTPMEKKYSHEEADPLYPIYTYMDSDLSGTAESGKADLSGLVGKQHGFDTVKPVQLIKYLIQTFAGKDDTVVAILTGIEKPVFEQFKFNPEEFIIKAAALINDEKATAIIQHITYNVLDEHYDTDIFTEPTIKGKLGTNAMKAQRHLYDHIVYDSTNERDFATDLDTNTDVAVYVKLPDSFYIATPVGHYNPDWAIAFYEGSVKHIYFVAETKGTLDSMHFNHITPVEQAKIDCARVHFKAISDGNVVYDVVDSYQTLLEKVMK